MFIHIEKNCSLRSNFKTNKNLTAADSVFFINAKYLHQKKNKKK